ncbi:DNA polymerase III subunit gamma and tau [Paenarthrobacter sp. Z7-10]|uniref:DNA polymerase III subunit gamma and tau n=1 Tax=Paenarthrobacter sp. Z7-10 TaxID=2787635 RepID=UPI003FA6B13F
MAAPTALYRRYRPDSFADVIGQEHVTEPLMAALAKNRVSHAYLFSGPRGCGKTTSARILARCLNCAQGPTAVPCGRCDSCVELARGGSGSLDVIEIDAASHGGVDDARDLRERATFAPVRDRYKIFIIDEAHMVTSAGFNALLKIVEEPPEHIKFIFATTEPDKVIGTIRSRTHHYPFRLVPPEPLMAYLGQLCQQEQVAVAPGVLSLVIRAGGGSVRDSLSVLDQLMAGAGPSGLDYELAVSLLGYTHASLLDDVVDALAASDSGSVFRSVDRVIQTGHDPRRFVEDLLERFRDLIIVQAMPESAHAILRGMPEDQISRMQTQSTQLGAAELSRAADVTNNALTEMTGATSPRLHLELLSARLLLPGADQSGRGMAARLDRIERRLSYGVPEASAGAPPQLAGSIPALAAESIPEPAKGRDNTPAKRDADRSAQGTGQDTTPTASGSTGDRNTEQGAPAPIGRPRVSTGDWPADEFPSGATDRSKPPAGASAVKRPESQGQSGPPSKPPSTQQTSEHQRSEEQRSPAAESAARPGTSAAPTPEAGAVRTPGNADGQAVATANPIEVLRRAWQEILDSLAKVKRSSWALVAPNATPQAFDGETLQLAFNTEGLAGAFSRGDHAGNLQAAINTTLGIQCRVTPVVGGSSAGSSSEPGPKVHSPANPAAAPAAGRTLTDNASSSAGLTPAGHKSPPPGPASSDAGPADPADPAAYSVPSARTAAATLPAPREPRPAERPKASAAAPSKREDQPVARNVRDPEEPPYSNDEPVSEWDVPPEYIETPRTRTSSSGTAVDSQDHAQDSAQSQGARQPQGSRDGLGAGQVQTPRLADPGWGAISDAPDWAKPPAAGLTPAQATQKSPTSGTVWAPAPPAQPASGAPGAGAPGHAQAPARPQTPEQVASVGAGGGTGLSVKPKMSLYERLKNSPEAQAARATPPERKVDLPYVEDIPSADDETIEESTLVGRAAVERILGGRLIEERSINGS